MDCSGVTIMRINEADSSGKENASLIGALAPRPLHYSKYIHHAAPIDPTPPPPATRLHNVLLPLVLACLARPLLCIHNHLWMMMAISSQ
jgi:hypothetical protein